MSGLEVHGRHPETDAYRVSVAEPHGRLTGLVPSHLMDTPPLGAPRHQPAYEWIARHAADIEASLLARAAGRAVRSPFDIVSLETESDDAD